MSNKEDTLTRNSLGFLILTHDKEVALTTDSQRFMIVVLNNFIEKNLSTEPRHQFYSNVEYINSFSNVRKAFTALSEFDKLIALHVLNKQADIQPNPTEKLSSEMSRRYEIRNRLLLDVLEGWKHTPDFGHANDIDSVSKKLLEQNASLELKYSETKSNLRTVAGHRGRGKYERKPKIATTASI